MVKKILTGLIGLVIVSVISIMCYVYFTTKSEKYVFEDEVIKDNMYDYVFNTNDTLVQSVVVIKDELRGYISFKTGEVLFEPQFRYAWVDNGVNNLAACVNRENRLGFVNIKTKEVAIPFQYDFDEVALNSYSFGYKWYDPNCKFDFVFSNGLCIVPGQGGRLGLINEKGDLVLPIKYSDIRNWRETTSNIILEEKLEGNNKFSYEILDRNFKRLLPYKLDNVYELYLIDLYKNGIINCYVACKQSKWGVLDSLCNEKVPYMYDNIIGTEYNIFIASKNGKLGVINDKNEQILSFEYDYIKIENLPGYYYRDGIYAQKGYIPMLFDIDGTLLNDFYIPQSYYAEDETSGFDVIQEPFEGGASKYIQYELDGRLGVIDGDKRVVIEPKYTKIRYLGNGNFRCSYYGEVYFVHDNQ